MARVYFDKKGRPQGLPTGQEEAKKYQTTLYIDYDNLCPECNNHVFYTKNNFCTKCAQIRACDLYSYLNALMEFKYDPIQRLYFTSYYEVNGLTGVANRLVPKGYEDELEELASLMYIVPPISIEDAIKRGETLWLTGDPCRKAGHYGIKTLENKCYFCEEERNKPKPRRDARKAGKQWYIPIEPCDKCGTISERNVRDNCCRGCSPLNPRAEARKKYQTWYTPIEPCDECGTISKRNVVNNRCLGCKPLQPVNKPRVEARKNKENWYIPSEPCIECNTLSERNVQDNRCSGCVPIPVVSETPEQIMIKAQPDLILLKETAIALGMKVYRTGKPCRRGHSGYRYVSTNNCIDCLKRR